jgi:hypothetical protein
MQCAVAQLGSKGAFTAPSSCGNELNLPHNVEFTVVYPQNKGTVKVVLYQLPKCRFPK